MSADDAHGDEERLKELERERKAEADRAWQKAAIERYEQQKREVAEAKQRAEEEAEAKRRAEEEAASRRIEEEEARQRAAAEEEAKRRAEEEVARWMAEEEAAAKRDDEAAVRRQAEQEVARWMAEEDAIAQRRADDDGAKRRLDEEAARRMILEQHEAARKHKQERASRRIADMQEAVRRRAEEEEAARRRIEEQAAKRRAEEAEAGRRQAESEHARLIDEEEATKRLAEAEGARILAEEEAMRRAEVAARAAEEEAARHRAEEEEIAALMVPEEDLPAEAPAAEPPAPVPPEPAEPESEILLVETPDAGFFAAMGYLFAVIRARRDRDRHLAAHTGALDDDRAAREATLLDLGRQARSAKLASPELADANAEIDEMENRRTLAESALGDVGEARGRLGAELAHAEGPLIGRVEELERQLESVSVEEKATTTAALSSARGELAGVRREHLERRGALDKDEARYRRELAAAEAQVERALRALGSVLDTHRPEEPALRACFDRLDQLASATSKTQATIDRLNAEREAYDRRTYRQGVAALVVACLALATVAIFATLLLL